MIVFVFHFYKPRDVRATFSIVVGLDDKPTKYEEFKFADMKGKNPGGRIRTIVLQYPRRHPVWKNDQVAFDIVDEELPYHQD